MRRWYTHNYALLPICQEVSKPVQQVALYSIAFHFEGQTLMRDSIQRFSEIEKYDVFQCQ